MLKAQCYQAAVVAVSLSIIHPSIEQSSIQQFTHSCIHLSFHPSFHSAIPLPLVSADCIILLISVLQIKLLPHSMKSVCKQKETTCQSAKPMENIKIWSQSLYGKSGFLSPIGYPLPKCIISIGSWMLDAPWVTHSEIKEMVSQH